jgi:hypothetical protein
MNRRLAPALLLSTVARRLRRGDGTTSRASPSTRSASTWRPRPCSAGSSRARRAACRATSGRPTRTRTRLDPTKPGRFADRIGCTDCHGGDASRLGAAGVASGSATYLAARDKAHVLPDHPQNFPTSGTPRSATPTGRRSAGSTSGS